MFDSFYSLSVNIVMWSVRIKKCIRALLSYVLVRLLEIIKKLNVMEVSNFLNNLLLL